MPAPKKINSGPVKGSSTLADRVRLLIDGPKHRGNARAAARDAKIPIATFFRMLDGSVKKPRADAVEKLSKLYGVSTDWLLLGEGRGPDTSDPDRPASEFYEWARAIAASGVNRETAELLADLPLGLVTLSFAYLPGDVQLIRSSERHKESPRLDEARRLEANAHIAWLRGLVETIGQDAARERLEAAADGLRAASLTAVLRLINDGALTVEQLRATGFAEPVADTPANVSTTHKTAPQRKRKR